MDTTLISGSLQSDADTDFNFDDSLSHLHAHFVNCSSNNSKFFLTDISGDNLWSIYQESLRTRGGEAAVRQMNCYACRDVVRKLGGVVTVADDGSLIPVMWAPNLNSDKTHGTMGEVYADMYDIISKRKIVSVWRSDDAVIGKRTTTSKSGKEWSHFYFAIPKHVVVDSGSSINNASQLMADSKERFRMLMSAETGIHKIKLTTIQTVVRLLSENELYRSDTFLAPAKFHLSVKEAITSGGRATSLVWKGLMDSPIGWANVNSTMIGTLYSWIESLTPIDDIKRMWNSRMDPDQYQRAQSAPSQGELNTAERIIEKLGASKSLERRFARLDEIRCIWLPTPAIKKESAPGGVFSNIRPKKDSFSLNEIYPTSTKLITWEKFRDVIMPTAESMEFLVPPFGGYCAFVTASHEDAPPIIQWDTEEDRYPVSSYSYSKPISAQQWNLVPGTYVNVTGIAPMPNFGEMLVIILDGCQDRNQNQGLGLFNEILKPEFHEIRKVMEAYSNNGILGGREESSACGWQISRNSFNVKIRVKIGDEKKEYQIDRFD